MVEGQRNNPLHSLKLRNMRSSRAMRLNFPKKSNISR